MFVVESMFENPIVLLICYGIFAVALFTYLYTSILICQRGMDCTKKRKRICLPMVCRYECLTENWLISTEIQQSPLNIETHNHNNILPMLNWENHDVVPAKMILENNGETLLLHAVYDTCTPSVSGADLENRYNFVNVSFRWGCNSSFGADHVLNNQTYPLEMQIMYYFGPIRNEISSRRILIVAYLFEIGNFNEPLELIIRNMSAIRKSGFGIQIKEFPLGALFPLCTGGFCCYIGTMTLPPYYEGIKWFVYSKPLSLNLAQLREFHKLLGSNMEPIKQKKRTARCV